VIKSRSDMRHTPEHCVSPFSAQGIDAGDNPPVTAAAPRPKPDTKIDIYDIAHRLGETADELRANSHLKAAEYSIPVLGLIFLKFADSRFAHAETELAGSSTDRRHIGKANYQAKGVLHLPPQSLNACAHWCRRGSRLSFASIRCTLTWWSGSRSSSRTITPAASTPRHSSRSF
jgi:hypothetical protein